MSLLEAVKQVQDAAARELNGDPTAHAELLESIHKLQVVATTPAEKEQWIRFQIYQNASLRMALEYGILQALAGELGKAMSAAELSQVTKADELLIVRLMRLITYLGIADEVGLNTYKANEATTWTAQKGVAAEITWTTDISMRVCSHVGPMVGNSTLQQFPESHQPSPITAAFGKPLFPFINENKVYRQAFDDFMTARRAEVHTQWFKTFPAADRFAETPLKQDSDAVLLVDVGGGQGYWTQQFQQSLANTIPGRLIVQDLPFVVRDAKTDGVETMEYDFMTPQPVKGARLYYFRTVMHDWGDKICRKILENTVEAMEKGYSTLLINDFVLPERNVGWRAASCDIAMSLLCSGFERTEKQWTELLDSVGLRIAKIWISKGVETSPEAVIECEKI